MNNVVIAEFDHYETTYALVKCFIREAKNIHVFSIKPFIDRLKQVDFGHDGISWHVADDAKEVLESGHIPQQPDIFLIAPTSHYAELVTIFEQYQPQKKLLWIRNVNYWFKMGTRYKVFKGPRSTDHKIMLDIVKSSDAIIVESDELRDNIYKKYRVKKPVFIFPYTLYEDGLQEHTDGDKVTISIPGYIERMRRDYDLVIDLIPMLDKEKFAYKFLGQPRKEYGEMIKNKALELKEQGYDIYLLESPEYFEREMMSTDIVFAPISVHTTFAGVEEVYGQTKTTGVTFDIIRFAKPGVFPEALTTSENLKNSVVKYSDINDLKEKLNRFLDAEYRDKMNKAALSDAQQYHVDNIAETFFSNINGLG